MNRLAPSPSPTDALIGVLVALVIGAVLLAVWWTAAGRFAAEPSLITPATAPNSEPVIAHLEEAP